MLAMSYRYVSCWLVLTASFLWLPAVGVSQDSTGTASKAETATSGQNGAAKKVSVPVIQLRGTVLEAPVADDPLFGTVKQEPLKDLVARLEKVRDDDSIPAVVLLLDNPMMGMGQREELYRALRQIRDKGKPVYAHVDSLTFPELTLLSAASRLSVAPVGELFITGMYGEQLYLRGLLDKLKVTPDFLTCGDYKSAGETFMRTGPSPEAARMYDWLFDSLFDTSIGLIAEGRGKSAETVRGWINHGLFSSAKAAELGIIDAVEHRDAFVEFVKKQHGDQVKLAKDYGKKKKGNIDFGNPFAVFQIWADLLKGSSRSASSNKPSVAIVYVEGPIVPGDAQPSPFGGQGGVAYSDPIRKALDKAGDDDSVKAVVLRVDSPGGSAVASEIILQASRRVAAKKPLIVSMGSVAGSGGYYVSCGTDTIFADASTITASIGVVAGKLATEQMWQQLGIHWHPQERGKNAGMLQGGKPFTEEQRVALKSWMDEVYEVFKGHVVRARGSKLTKPIDEIAGGRVFTGRQALELGLVDRLGTLHDAIHFAADRAGIQEKEYEIRVLPPPKSPIEILFADLADGSDDDSRIGLASPGVISSLWELARPALAQLEPNRAVAVIRALRQAEILQREGISLMMPEVLFGN